MIKGKAITFGANIDTDQILGAQHLTRPSLKAMAPYAFEYSPHFRHDFSRGDIIVASANFGCGSSREQAPGVLKERGVAAIVARSFARIFFRNAINLGLPLFECPEAETIHALDRLEIDHDTLKNLSTSRGFAILPLPPFIRALIDSGGVVAQLRDGKSQRRCLNHRPAASNPSEG